MPNDSSDTNQSQNTETDTAFSEQFLSELAERFDFSLSDGGNREELQQIRYRHNRATRIGDDKKNSQSERREYTKLLSDVDRFSSKIAAYENRHLIHELFLFAKGHGIPKPLTDFPELTEHETKRGEPYFLELIRLLNLLRSTLDHEIEARRDKGGRPENFPLRMIIFRIADFWEVFLGRTYAIDYHKGVGLTPAFEFTKAILLALGDYTDARIITSMRSEITSRNHLKTLTHRNLDGFSC